ncbi:MAG: DNA polymerase III subunit delta [Ardenticatenaceae bacterium]
MIYLFYGSDELSRHEYVANLLKRIEEPLGNFNQTRFQPDKLTFTQLRQACDALPFLTERRIVIVEGLLNKLVKRGPKAFTKQLQPYFSKIPDYTRLFLLEGKVDRRSALWKELNKLAKEKQPKVYLKEFSLPNEQQLPIWIQRRTHKHGGRIGNRAAAQLATFVGHDIRLLDQEIRKLVTYAGQEPITEDHIELLVPYMQEASIWKMVDAIGAKNIQTALMSAERLLQDDPSKAIYMHIMITRQIRILLQVAELAALGKKQAEIQKTLRLNGYVLKKVMRQASNFTVERLEKAYDLLLQADVDMKSGADQTMTLNLLIVQLAGGRGRR